MPAGFTLLVVLLMGSLLAGPVAAGDEENGDSTGASSPLTEAERKAATKRADALDEKVAESYARAAYAEAIALARESLSIRVQAQGDGHEDVATGLSNLALLLSAQGSYREARTLNERALRIYEKTLGRDHPYVATTLNNLALLLHEEAQYVEARHLQERALAIREKALGKDDPEIAQSLNNLAGLLRALGAHAEAQRLYERALAICENAFGDDHPLVAKMLNNIAGLQMARGELIEARPLYERAVAILEKALGPAHPDIATALQNLGSLRALQGNHPEARQLFERALAMRIRVLGEGHPHVAISLGKLAGFLTEQGEHAAAMALQERALASFTETFGEDSPLVATSLHDLALLHAAAGQVQQALPLLARSLAIIEGHVRRSVAGLEPSMRLAMLRASRGYLHTYLRLAGDQGHTGYVEVLRFKGLLARTAAAERRLARRQGVETGERVDALRAAERRLARLASSPPSFRERAKKDAWQEAYAQAAVERRKLALALTTDLAPLRTGLERLDLHLADVQRSLPEHAVLIDYLDTGNRFLVWVVPKTGSVRRFDLGPSDAIEAAATALAEESANPDSTGWAEAGRALSTLIFAPLGPHMDRKTTRLWICPDAALAAVPFAALPGADTSLLGTTLTISTISMAQDLVPWQEATESGHGALLLGGVDYGSATATPNAPGVRMGPAARADRYAYLPGSSAEVEAIKPRLGAGSVALSGAGATEAAFRTASKGKQVLHLATHGFVRDDLLRGLVRRLDDKRWLGADMEQELASGHDPMSMTGLALAGANVRAGGGDDDGILTALEASHLELDGVDLVVLSACQTALGKTESGEGVIGLVRGFQMAGARQVVGSLWKVDDDATRAMMARFYELWNAKEGPARVDVATALRRAQAFVRSHEKWKHPYYWAAWVAWGG